MTRLLMPQHKSAKLIVPKAVTFIDLYAATGDKTDYSGDFDIIDISAVAAQSTRRAHILYAGSNGTTTMSSMTVNGVTATQNDEVPSSNRTVGCYTVSIPTGTTLDIDPVWGAGQLRTAIAVYVSVGLSSNTEYHSITDGTTTDPSTGTLNTLTGGFALGLGCVAGVTAGSDISWATLSKDDEASIEGTDLVASCASLATSSSSAAVSVSSASDNIGGMVAVSF